MSMIFFWLSAIAMTLTAVLHSFAGEKRLIGPLLAIDHPVTNRPLAQMVLRFAWHLTSLFMLLTAALVIWPNVPEDLVLTTGALWLVVGIFDAIYTRGQHIGWPLLTLAGLFAILGYIL